MTAWEKTRFISLDVETTKHYHLTRVIKKKKLDTQNDVSVTLPAVPPSSRENKDRACFRYGKSHRRRVQTF